MTCREPLRSGLLALVALTGCSVDVSKLRGPGGKGPDADADAARDLAPGVPEDAGGLGAPGDEPGDTTDADAGADHGPVADGHGLDDAADDSRIPGPDAMAARDAWVPADLPPGPGDPPTDSPTLPPDSPGLRQDAGDPPADSPDLAGRDVRDTAPPDRGPDADDGDAASDPIPPADTSEAGGQSNGAPCTSPAQCQSGFCVGVPGRCCVQSCASVCYRANQCSTTGACVAAAGAITCGDSNAVCGLSVRDYPNASDWSWQLNLQVGDLATGSDEHTISAVPSELQGSPWIRPSRNSKPSIANPLVTFTLSAPADVYVGIDTRFSPPSWLSTWTDSGMTVSYVAYSSYEPATTVTQRLYHARFPAGSVSLGPLGCTYTSSCSMYLTIVRFADQPSGTTPACK